MYIGNLRKKNGDKLSGEEWGKLIDEIKELINEKDYVGFIKTTKKTIII